jgi:hypothetical protein
MQNKIVSILVVMLLITTVVSAIGSKGINENNVEDHPALKDTDIIVEDGTEYWALLVAGGIYANNPAKRLDVMPVVVEKLHNTLLVSEQWGEDHIKVIKWKNATHLNIIKGFRWLDQMEDENDICLIYLTTHGGPLRFDIPPLDEEDGMDEILATYGAYLPFKNPWTQKPLLNPFGFITDDEINYFLNRLESQGICVIVDSCHSGGFNDNWSCTRKAQSVDFAREFGNDLQGRNRIVMTSVGEEELCYGMNWFTYYLIEGMKGYADSNDNGVCSAEEAFWYAKPIIRNIDVFPIQMHPRIFDDYPGELSLTEVELPPSTPIVEGEIIGKTNTTYTYQFYSEDPEEDKIKYFVDWGDKSNDSSGLFASGEAVNFSHSWDKDGTYVMRMKAEDEKGAASDDELMITMTDKYDVDQRQVKVDSYKNLNRTYDNINKTYWLAQSFTPSLNTLAKIELGLLSDGDVEVTIAIRKELNGDDLVTSSVIPPIHKWWEWDIFKWNIPDWVMFDFTDIELTPGEKYYIVCRCASDEWGVSWSCKNGDPYMNGSFYYSNDTGDSWMERHNFDANFVTYGK